MKTILSLLLASVLAFNAYSQSIPIDSIFSRMEQQAMLYPTEKIYLHTDRDIYAANETIWVKAYVVDGITNIPAKRSRYVYVTLQNPFNKTVSHVCMRADKDGYIHGYVPLPDELPKGEYTLSAYTRYMQQGGEDYFFKKRISVNSVKNNSIRMETKRRGSHLDILFRNPVTKDVMKVNNCVTYIPTGEINVQKKDSGWTVKFHESAERVLLVQAGNYKEFVHLDTKPDFDVSFLPEGGNLIAGQMNRIAFKAVNTQGQGENIHGTIRDDRDSVLLRFNSLHRGMGILSFIPETGKKYIAVCENSDGRKHKFTLPETTEGYSLQVHRSRGNFFVKVLASEGTVPSEPLFILAHQKGWPIMVHPYESVKDSYTFQEDRFMPGTVSFVLATGAGQILNERMAFVYEKDYPQYKLASVKPDHNRREKVSLSLNVTSVNGDLWNGECSISVTDNQDIRPDSCCNILSTLLLESELKGHIENPAWYFRQGNERRKELALDILMMTQGWRRYDLESVWKANFNKPDILHETSQTISGKVTRRVSRKPVDNAKVQMMIPSLGVNEAARTASDGTFILDGFEYPDSTLYWISAYTSLEKDNVVLELDSIISPELKNKRPPFREENLLNPPPLVSQAYTAKADMRILQDKGMRHIFMDEVIVTAPRRVYKTDYERLLNTKTIREEEIEQSGALNIGILLAQKIPGVSIGYNEMGFRYVMKMGTPVTFVLDGCIIYNITMPSSPDSPHDIILNMNKDDIAQIDLIRGADGATIAPYAGGAIICLTTKRGDEKYNAKWHPTNLKTTMPLGYQVPAEFYAPKYELQTDKDSKGLDLRTTIHWQPRLEVKNGKANVEFYTADGMVDYTVVIEGVGEDGSLLRVEEKIR